MKKARAGYQLYRAITGMFREGIDKHSMKCDGTARDSPLVFGETSMRNLLDFADNFCAWAKARGEKIGLVKDIPVSLWNEFLQDKVCIDKCHKSTITTYMSNIRKLGRVVNAFYREADVDWSSNLKKPYFLTEEDKEIARIQQMTTADYGQLIECGNEKGGRSGGHTAIQVSRLLGARVEGCATVRVRDVYFDRASHWGFGQVRLKEKGGRIRYVDIKTKEDQDFFRKLIQGKQPDVRLIGINKDSINKYVNRTMHDLDMKERYPETSIHSIRKLYAQETWDNYRNHDHSYDEALRYVNEQLGHGRDRNIWTS